MKNSLIRRWFGRVLVCMVLVCAAGNVFAEAYITEIMALGAKSGKGEALKTQYRDQGWTVLDKDLNDNAKGWDVYIAYKTSDNADPENGYITDICVSTKWHDPLVFEGRTYYHAPTNSGFNGDLNRDAGGAYIWLYYTRERTNLSGQGGTRRVLTKLQTTEQAEDGHDYSSPVNWRAGEYSGAADMNKKAGGDDIFVQQYFSTQTLSVKNAPKAAENIVYDGTQKFLIPNNPSGNWGTMKYRIGGSGTFSSSLPRATMVGSYTVEYMLDGGIYAYNSEVGSLTATIQPPVSKASTFDATFNQTDRAVYLVWEGDPVPGGYIDYKWVLYRGKTKVATLNYNQHSYSDTGFQNETEETYTLYYVANGWDADTKRDDAAISCSVNCTRTVPVNNFEAEGHTDFIELTWTSDGYPEGFGNKFNIYVDNETQPICTITPKAYQTAFVWHHRTTGAHSDRQNKVDQETNIPYTEEPLNGCVPHDYRVEGVIGTTVLNEASAPKKSIGQGTLFLGLEADKGVDQGSVKLSWQVNQQQETFTAKNYIIDRRMAEKAGDSWTTIHRMTSADEYVIYTDMTPQPGVYYDYRVTVQDKCPDGTFIENHITDIGFAHTTGTVSGRITYGTTGTAVAGVDVVAALSEGAAGSNAQYHSMHFADSTAAVMWQYQDSAYQANLLTGDFSVQLWIYPEQMNSQDRGFLFFSDNNFLGLTPEGRLTFHSGDNTGSDVYTFEELQLQKEAYSFITLTRSGSTLNAYLLTTDEKGAVTLKSETKTLTKGILPVANPTLSMFGVNTNDFFRLGYFKGYVDELRLWTRSLSEQDIRENFDHLLVGNEKNLETYWTFDEGLRYQFFDYSRDGTFFHQHHGKVGNNAESSTLTPSALALKAKTDQNGNYIIQGVPFSGEGATYSIVPTMGIHRFNPSQQLRYVGNNSLVHNSVDFDDVSSFNVRGVVYYENTTIPVQGAYIYVDGSIASRDGEAVMTNDYGEFEVSVPIGDHFVAVKMNGHTFLNDGRYPADPDGVGVRHTFDREISGLTFFDQTKVTVAGRVVGGDIEHEKPLGLGLSQANIGQAKIQINLSNENGYLNAVMSDPSSTTVSYDINPETMRYEGTSGKVYVPGGKNYIVVETDATTGEWVAQLPPLRYDVTNITIPSRPAEDMISKENFTLPVIDATKPANLFTDSVQGENGEWRKIEYVASAKMLYKAPSVITVTENNDGSFGMRSYTVKDQQGNEHRVPLYKVDEQGVVIPDANGKVQYTFGYPVYEVLGSAMYRLYAYERYTNYDGTAPTVTDVPLAGKNVLIKNQFASTTAVSVKDEEKGIELGEQFVEMDEELTLDADGKALYQFSVGFPNIQPPYTRGLSVTYDNNGTMMSWDGNEDFKVIVLGGIPTGVNFVTQGPDQVMMVLRDPPGSNSKTTWNKGATYTMTSTSTSAFNDKNELKTLWRLGAKIDNAIGNPGMMIITETESKDDITINGEYFAQRLDGHTTVHSITTSRDISTSDSHEFTGAMGDVFIGASQNLLFGMNFCVDIDWDPLTNTPILGRDTAVSVGEEFTTFFTYDQYYIRTTLLPNYIMLRNNLLKQVADPASVARPARGEDPIYISKLKPDDPKYGTGNNDKDVWGNQAVPVESITSGRYEGPSYIMLLPEGYELEQGKVYQDMITFYNTQIAKWERQLYLNEEAKVKAINDRTKYLRQNYSISAGTTVSESVSNTKSKTDIDSDTDGFNVIFGNEFGYYFGGWGLGVTIMNSNGKEWKDEDLTTRDTTEVMSFTLADSDYADYLTVDVFDSVDNFSPIFATRGGATSCPYEDEDLTVYYQPGTSLSAKTMQIEKPEIEVQTPVVTGVPAGGEATIKINLRNLCELGFKLPYDLKVTSGSNPDGLSVTMDGVNLGRGTSVYLLPDETQVKTLVVRQTNPEVLKYENIKLRLASQCQSDPLYPRGEIADYATFSVYFQPTCSDIILESSHTLVNTDTEEPVTLSMSGYNYPMSSLTGVRLQYKGENDADFRTLQEYVKDEAKLATDPTLKLLPALEGTAKLNYVLDLRSSDFADKTYVFRAVTVCDQGGQEVNNESGEIRIVRNLSRPQLIATPSPSNGILTSADDLLITFNEAIQGSALTKPNNFDVVGILNEGEIAHDVALQLSDASTAKTDATLNLAGKSFSLSMWLKYTADGTILTHGTADHHMELALTSQQLCVRIADQTVKSTSQLPMNKWLYLHVSYNAESRTVTAGYAMDDATVLLIDNKQAGAYSGNGAISLGGQHISAQIQELVLWDGTRSMAEAQRTMYTTKSRYTHGLLGYWPLNEGHGPMAADIARSRHLTLASAAGWWVDGENYALVLDGNHAATVNIGALNTTEEEDYLVEAWFRADKTQTENPSILATDRMNLLLDEHGCLQILLGESQMEVLHRDLRDGVWHHLAINVLKSTNGSGIIYVDGEPCKQIVASAMPVLHGSDLTLGQGLKGAIDEIRIWKARRTAEVIKNGRYARLMGNEAGLAAYYPLEKFSRDEYNQVITTSTLKDLLTETAISAEGLSLSTINTAPLKPAPKNENVQFSFVTSDTKIRINIDELPARIEGCNISLTAKRVKDLYGNEAQPVTWCVYVQQANLRWLSSDIEVTKSGVEPVSFTATIENRGSQSESWSISGLPLWLTANVEGGSLMPLASATLTFSVAENLPIGTYETDIYLTGSQNIAIPLHVTVTSEGETPEWSVVPGEESMTIIGVLNIDGIQSSDTKDIIAAFSGTECVGLAHPQYFSRYDSYMVLLTIYGKAPAALSYKLYDASTGTIYPSVSVSNEAAYTFGADKDLGTFIHPVTFSPLNEIEQDLSHDRASWKWFSLYVQPKVNTLEAVFSNAQEAISVITDGANTIMDGMGNLESFSFDKMYKLLATAPFEETLIGEPVDPTSVLITLKANGWTWIGYPAQATNSLDAAFTGAEPLNGDMVKSQSAFALYTEGEWIGSLRTMMPGNGYKYKSNASVNKTFNFPKPAASGRLNAPAQTLSDQPAPVGGKDNMTMICKVEGVDELRNEGVKVYVGDELAGVAMKIDSLYFLTISSNTSGTLRFETEDGIALSTLSEDGISTIYYMPDAHHGSLKAPVILTPVDNRPYKIIENGHVIIIRNGDRYDLTGKKL